MFANLLVHKKERKMLRRIRQTLSMLVIVGVLMNSGLFGMGAPVQAGAEGLWARWQLQLDFAEKEIHAVWTVAIGDYDPSVWPSMKVIAQKSETIECTPQGSFHILNDEAIFDGKGYLECAIPSFYHAALDLAKENGRSLSERFLERCECVNPIPWLTADLTVVPSESPNPIVHEVNGAFDFYTPLNGALQATSAMFLNGNAIAPSPAWTLRENGNQIWSGTGTESFMVMSDPNWSNLGPGFVHAAQNTPVDHFLHWENANGGNIFPAASAMYITNLATTFTIGFDGSNYFKGKIKKLAWDPGCTAH
jgi:hypothetical protein